MAGSLESGMEHGTAQSYQDAPRGQWLQVRPRGFCRVLLMSGGFPQRRSDRQPGGADRREQAAEEAEDGRPDDGCARAAAASRRRRR